MKQIPGILVLYHHYLEQNASTIMEHASSFQNYSENAVWMVNTELGFPKALNQLRFDCIVVHYSFFNWLDNLNKCPFIRYVAESTTSYRVVFFQDEFRYCKQRFAFINHCDFQCVYTLVEPEYFKDTYAKYTKAKHIFYTIPGLVDNSLIELSKHKLIPDEQKKYDIGYRGRELPFWMGKGGQEKTEIAHRFIAQSGPFKLTLNIKTDEESRLYGDAWTNFILNCRATLGVESGTSIFDVEGVIKPECDAYLKENPKATFDDLLKSVLWKYEERIPYRTISPRHFEAAALHSCQILYEGKYSGMMEPMRHYIPLKNDFSNLDEVVRIFLDKNERQRITENAYQDLIVNNAYTFQNFVGQFDRHLQDCGLKLQRKELIFAEIEKELKGDYFKRYWLTKSRYIKRIQFPGRKYIVPAIKGVLGLKQSSD